MRRTLAVVLVLSAAVIHPRTASADSIIQFVPFSGSAIDTRTVTPFNPSLGTLDLVRVGISGSLTVTGVTLPLFVEGPGGIPLPRPYEFGVAVDQRFFGLAGKYFEFLDPTRFVFTSSASGLGGSFGFTTTYSYGFQFTAASEGFVFPSVSAGSAAVIPSSGIGGFRADFLDTILPIDQIQLVQLAFGIQITGPSPLVTGFSTTALMEIRYDYTPASTNPDPVVPVPEPGTLLLLASGMAAWAARRRRR